jgi:hypothetical protein
MCPLREFTCMAIYTAFNQGGNRAGSEERGHFSRIAAVTSNSRMSHYVCMYVPCVCHEIWVLTASLRTLRNYKVWGEQDAKEDSRNMFQGSTIWCRWCINFKTHTRWCLNKI